MSTRLQRLRIRHPALALTGNAIGLMDALRHIAPGAELTHLPRTCGILMEFDAVQASRQEMLDVLAPLLAALPSPARPQAAARRQMKLAMGVLLAGSLVALAAGSGRAHGLLAMGFAGALAGHLYQNRRTLGR